MTIDSLAGDADPVSVGVAVRTRHFPFRIGRLIKRGGGHQITPTSLVLSDPRPHHVSRDHCVMEVREERLWVRDSGSTLGTIVNGTSVGLQHRSMAVELVEGENSLLLGGAHSPHHFRVIVVKLG